MELTHNNPWDWLLKICKIRMRMVRDTGIEPVTPTMSM